MEFWKLKGNIGTMGRSVFCDLHKACKDMNNRDIQTGTRQNTIDAIERQVGDVDEGFTLVTHSGDWGIKKTECKFTSTPVYAYNIESAAHGGVYLNLEIDSVINRASRWFMTNMHTFLHDKIYPIPLGVNHVHSRVTAVANKNQTTNIDADYWNNFDIEKIRSIKSSKLCYANFTMTSPYRIRVAEWAWKQQFIDCNFPKRYATQDVELNMPILRGTNLTIDKFMETLASYQFAIAPAGNGIDTFRTWECILCNTVPVVRDHWMNRVFSRIWPMVLVGRYEFTNVFQAINDFYDKHGRINYDYSLLLEENFDKLLDRIQYESDRLRRETLQLES